MKTINCINLSVETKSGIHLGRVEDVEVDLDQQIINYKVVGGLIPGLNKKIFLISPKQVLEIMAERMIVDDLVVKKEEDLGYPKLAVN